MTWSIVADSTGRVYYHNIMTDETSWQNPFISMLQETQDFAEDVFHITRRKMMMISIEIALSFRLRSTFQRWCNVLRHTHMQYLIPSLDAWLNMREALKRCSHVRDSVMLELESERQKNAGLVKELIEQRLWRADAEFQKAHALQKSLRK